jgi:hypothetical protein
MKVRQGIRVVNWVRETWRMKATIIVRMAMKVNKVMRETMEATMAVKKLSLFHAQLSQDMTRLAERMLSFPMMHLPTLKRSLKSASSL